MVLSGEPDQATASLQDWAAYRDHLRSLPVGDESVRGALAIAQIQKLQDKPVAAKSSAE